jgi:hypothetical protein
VQSGAAAEILTDLFGDDVAFTDHTHARRDYAPRSFSSFWDAAEEAAISRLYGGIHYRAAIEFGLEQGRAIGQVVNALPMREPVESQSPPADTYDSDVATAWSELQLMLIRTTPGFSPPVAARALGCSGLVLYESVVGGMPGHRSLAGAITDLTALPARARGAVHHWPLAANAALAEASRLLWPNVSAANRTAIDALEARQDAWLRVAIAEPVRDRSIRYGRAVARAIAYWSRSDGAVDAHLNNFPREYSPPVGPGLWVPTGPGFSPALQPYWGQNRCFALPAADACDPGAPPPYSVDLRSRFYAEALEVYDTTTNLTAEQMLIARWWADDPGATATPAGHSISILTQVLRKEKAKLGAAAVAYAKVGIALADAFISCWESKFRYNLLRPVTYIQQNIDPAWTSPIVTPPFPEYSSGHSVQSGAFAEVMTGIFGPDYAFMDDTNTRLGLAPRHFTSFHHAAEEAAVSRLYGGIHYRAAIDIGVQQGRAVGRHVLALPFERARQ